MNTADLTKEIAKRRAALSRAELTILDAWRAPFVSEPTTLALGELVKVVAAEHVVLVELERYRDAFRGKLERVSQRD